MAKANGDLHPAPVAFGYSNLLHELVFALVGYCGDVFIAPDGDQGAPPWCPGVGAPPLAVPHPDSMDITVAPDIDWVDAPDMQVLRSLLTLGFHYRSICAFVEKDRVLSADKGAVYRRALTAGLAEILELYRGAVVHVEQAVVMQPLPVLSSLQYMLADFQVLLSHLHSLAYVVDSQVPVRSPGSVILALLHSRSRCGQPVVESAMQRLLWHCHQVLYKQLASWMVHGVLQDSHGEFFIRPYVAPVVEAPAGAAAAAATAGAQPLPAGARAAAAATAVATGRASARWSEDAVYNDWHRGFEVDPKALPDHAISRDAAAAVLFVGKAVRVLRSPAGTFRGQELLPFRDELDFAQALQALQQQPIFNRPEFERTLYAIRTKVAAKLWQLVVVAADLQSHLAAIKDYFLLARGDFYQIFLVDADDLMSQAPRLSSATVDVAAPFQQAALSSTAQHDRLFPLFQLVYSPQPLQIHRLGGAISAPAFDAAWDGLQLRYEVAWPLGLLLTPTVLERYNMLFQLLFRLKRVQLKLEDAWRLLCKVYGKPSKEERAARGGAGRAAAAGRCDEALQLRHHMAHFITNLQIYIQVDVIESNYHVLEQALGSAQDFGEAERAHETYLAHLMTQSFLVQPALCRQIAAIFKTTLELCLLLAEQQNQGLALPTVDPAKVREIKKRYTTASDALYFSLQSVKLAETTRTPHLSQFWARLNFNHALAKPRD